MSALRFIGALLALLAVVAVVSDFTPRSSREPTRPRFASLATHWSEIAPQSMAAAKKTVQTKASPILWDPLIASVLGLPAWLSLGVLAAGLLYIGRRRKRVDIFVN